MIHPLSSGATTSQPELAAVGVFGCLAGDAQPQRHKQRLLCPCSELAAKMLHLSKTCLASLGTTSWPVDITAVLHPASNGAVQMTTGLYAGRFLALGQKATGPRAIESFRVLSNKAVRMRAPAALHPAVASSARDSSSSGFMRPSDCKTTTYDILASSRAPHLVAIL